MAYGSTWQRLPLEFLYSDIKTLLRTFLCQVSYLGCIFHRSWDCFLLASSTWSNQEWLPGSCDNILLLSRSFVHARCKSRSSWCCCLAWSDWCTIHEEIWRWMGSFTAYSCICIAHDLWVCNILFSLFQSYFRSSSALPLSRWLSPLGLCSWCFLLLECSIQMMACS